MLLVLALAATLAHISIASETCLSLAQSQACPGFAHEFISTNTTGRFSWFPKDNIAAFDKALNDYVSGQPSLDEFQSVFRCPGLDSLGGFGTDHGTSVVRYHRSMICADILFSEENLGDCYNANGANHKRENTGGDDESEMQLAKVVVATSAANARPSAPTPLCRSTCNAWIDSLRSIVSNTTLCQVDKGINRESSIDSLRTKCDLTMYGGAQGHCVNGLDNEAKTCGYQRVEDWCKYCKHAINYIDTCASVGVVVDGTIGDGSSNADASDTRAPILSTPTSSDHYPDSNLVAELQQQTRQERLFRIVAIILSIIVGVCLVALVVIIGLSRNDVGLGLSHNDRDNEGDANTGDGSTVLYLGTAGGRGKDEKASADFVDCFITTVGKPRQVLRHFFARRDDEISLQQGDIVTLQMAFDDGWVVGKNLTTGAEGTFPLMCVIENLPASLPAQWSVLPESNSASTENLRRPSRVAAAAAVATTRRSPHSSMLGSMSLPSGLDMPMMMAGGRSNAFDSQRASTILPNDNFGRRGNMPTPPDPIITTTRMPLSQLPTSTRTVPTSKFDYDSDGMLEAQSKPKGRALLDRLLGAFAMTSNDIVPTSDGGGETNAGFFKRLVSSPLFGVREKLPIRLSPKYNKPDGRPHSFSVSHVTHVGLTDPNFLRPGALSSSVPTIPTSKPSPNGYPVMSAYSSLGNDNSVRHQTTTNTNAADAPLGFPRQPNFSYGEFAPSNNSRQLVTTANASMDTYQTAEQSAYSNFGVQPLPGL
ncbi:hypothetical protein IWW38_001196 [Coemansia aciculifera]|uniref:Uncharacterized protein n=1 Tax=Coemansia aciculifera TaxID=417176 RepID=A0ACC1M7S3_9FUNG|nr:hypothetical protein IWW38_001196 [Coemansia aciculifera]